MPEYKYDYKIVITMKNGSSHEITDLKSSIETIDLSTLEKVENIANYIEDKYEDVKYCEVKF